MFKFKTMSKIIGLTILFTNAYSSNLVNNQMLQNSVNPEPKNTLYTTLMLCNLSSDDRLHWKLKSYVPQGTNGFIMGSGDIVQSDKECQIVAIRGESSQNGQVTNITDKIRVTAYHEPFGHVSLFDIKSISYVHINHRSYTRLNIGQVTDRNFIIYSSNHEWAPGHLESESSYANLSGGVVPDFVICYGGTPAQCKEQE
jgi:hypothetical protein